MSPRRSRRALRPRRLRRSAGVALAALAALSLAGGAGSAAAQGTDEALRRAVSGLGDSTVVWVIAPGVFVDPGLFLGVVGDSLRLSDADARLAVAFDELEELAVRKSQWLKVGATSAGVAAVFGLAIGYFIGTGNCELQLTGCGTYQLDGVLRYGGAFALAGGLVGGLVGSRQSTWRRIFP